MNTTKETAQLAAAIRIMLAECQRGEMLNIHHDRWIEAARLAGLRATTTGWVLGRNSGEYLEANGFNEKGELIDYEKFYAAREAWAGAKEKKRRTKNLLTIEK